MSDDDPVDSLVGGEEDEDEPLGPQARDMEAELRERTGVGGDLEPEDLEVDSDVATPFWAAVLYVNVGILLLSVGPLLYVARGWGLVSLALVGTGAGLLFRAYLVYRNFRTERDGEEANADEADSEAVETNDDDTAPNDDR